MCLRIRPPLPSEARAERHVFAIDGTFMYVEGGGENDGASTPLPTGAKQEKYRFHKVFDESATNETIFDDVGLRVVQDTLDGYNTCVLAYGQVGSGKSHTMNMLIPRIVSEMFSRLASGASADESAAGGASGIVTYSVRASFLEIAEERLKDLLVRTHESTDLQIRQPTPTTIYVDGLTKKAISNVDEFMFLYRIALKARRVDRNLEYSSHTGHCICSLLIKREERSCVDAEPVTTECCMELVDLAGTSRPTPTSASDLAAYNISNKSLVSLSVVINKLANQEAYVPYRTSKLTALLAQAFGGDAKTYMLATVGPIDTIEGRRTIKYAQYAMTVVNRATRAQPKGLAIEKLKSAFSALVTETQARKATQLSLDEIMKLVRRANNLCEKTEKSLIFSVQPDDDISAMCAYGVRVTSRDSTKTDLWDPATLADRIAAEEEWLRLYWDETSMQLRVANPPVEPFYVPVPEQQIGSASVSLEPLLRLQPNVAVSVPVLSGSNAIGSLQVRLGSAAQQPSAGGAASSARDVAAVTYTVSIDSLSDLVTEHGSDMFVRYQFPADDYGDVHATQSVNLAPGRLALGHTHDFECDGGAELESALTGSELVLEVYGHEDEIWYYPSRLRQVIRERDAEIAALKAEIERLNALVKKGAVAQKRAKQLQDENDALRAEIASATAGSSQAVSLASAGERRLRDDLIATLEGSIAADQAERARDLALTGELERTASALVQATVDAGVAATRLASAEARSGLLAQEIAEHRDGWASTMFLYQLLRRAAKNRVENESADV